MIDYRIIEQRLFEVLGLQRRPVAVAFRENAPAGISRFTERSPPGAASGALLPEDKPFIQSRVIITTARLAATPIT